MCTLILNRNRIDQNEPTRFHPGALTCCHSYLGQTQTRQRALKAFDVRHRTVAECDPAPSVNNSTSKLFFLALTLTWVPVHYRNRLNKTGQGLAAKTAIIRHPSTLSHSLPAPGRAPLQHSPQEWSSNSLILQTGFSQPHEVSCH